MVKIFLKHSIELGFTLDENDFDFLFIISDQDELNYTKNLLEIYKNVYLRFINKHKEKLETNSEIMSRLFFIGGLNSILMEKNLA